VIPRLLKAFVCCTIIDRVLKIAAIVSMGKYALLAMGTALDCHSMKILSKNLDSPNFCIIFVGWKSELAFPIAGFSSRFAIKAALLTL
jgi:hypothetical protein